MATLTASGLNGADGTLNGQYTGTAYNYTAYPIGSYVLFRWGGLYNQNSNTTSIWASSGTPQILWGEGNQGGGTGYALAGTWRQRGVTSPLGCYYYYLAQRVA